MPVPMNVQLARQRGDFEALSRMSKKSQRTRAAKRDKKKDAAEKRAAEEVAAEEWYQERRAQEKIANEAKEPWVVRRDDLLPPDQL